MRGTRAPDPWQAHRHAQAARRHRRVALRLTALRDLLPPGVTAEAVGTTALRVSGYGVSITYDAVHHSADVGGGLRATMTPREVANEFRWRWKREGCPGEGG